VPSQGRRSILRHNLRHKDADYNTKLVLQMPHGISEELAAIMKQIGKDAAEAVAHEIMARAVADIPVGDPALDPNPMVSLRTSGEIQWVDDETLELGFFNPYAVKQHELRGFRHPRGGGSKFLERNVQMAGPQFQVELEKRVRTYFVAAARPGRTFT
jgi:hypothetical protein